jgi:hypothetical protein
MADLRRIKHELERLVLARGDVAAARAGWAVLNAFEELRLTSSGRRAKNIKWDDAWWSLWTGAVVSYARPFTQSRTGMTLGKRWWGRIDDPDAKTTHKWVMNFRDSLWAHTDQGGASGGFREVVVSRRTATERRTSFAAPANFPRLAVLCDLLAGAARRTDWRARRPTAAGGSHPCRWRCRPASGSAQRIGSANTDAAAAGLRASSAVGDLVCALP